MQYKVEDLATACGVKVDTIRFYQGKGLIAPPSRQGRNAVYGPTHLARIRQIRALLVEGFSLAQIQKVDPPDSTAGASTRLETESSSVALLRALAQERGVGRFRRAELAERAGVPQELVDAAQAAGLLEPTEQDGEEFFSSVDLEMLGSGLSVLGAGLPLTEFLEIAAQHDHNIRDVSEKGIDLFDDHVRKVAANGDDPEVVAQAFQQVLPQLTKLVALHFQRTLVNRAMKRLRAKGEGPALERALAAVEATHLEGEWRK
ncbi:MAG: MerR family transcriptional regulator [Myxococcota bacterium]|jgi:DNA-binding transcriptional MerR regulator